MRLKMKLSMTMVLGTFVVLTASAPTKIDSMKSAYRNSVLAFTDKLCAISQRCLFGDAHYDSVSMTCICPASVDLNPCAHFDCVAPLEPFYSFATGQCFCEDYDIWISDDYISEDEQEDGSVTLIDDQPDLHKRQDEPFMVTETQDATDEPLPTYVPPPKKDITPELIQQSLALQPQNTAIVSSVIPHFLEDTIDFHVQLNGQVAVTLVMTASTSLPCGVFNFNHNANIILVPRTVKNDSPQTIIAKCQCIAVNMYTPDVITYWIQNEDGEIRSVAGSNKVFAIDQIDTSAGANLTMVISESAALAKRDLITSVDIIPIERRQVYEIGCGKPCPFYHMHEITGANGYCGCIFKGADEEVKVNRRGIVQPGPFTAKMTPEACAAMKCTDIDDKPAVFNPFSLTCWCTKPVYVDENPNAWVSSVTNS